MVAKFTTGAVVEMIIEKSTRKMLCPGPSHLVPKIESGRFTAEEGECSQKFDHCLAVGAAREEG
jgi:hypothetical protein